MICVECRQRRADLLFALCRLCARKHYPPEPQSWVRGDSSAQIAARIRAERASAQT